jgi:catechol 2,3-dioxygenase-like lactoylglutathione lyase family enzyme
MPERHIAHVALLVRDYDEAIAWFTGCLDFTLIEDSPRTPTKRWVLVSPSERGTALLLARAATPEQQAAIGRQGGGRVMFFLRTDDFRRDYQRMNASGVRFVEQPREEEYGRVVVFEDLYGNRWDLVESNQPS